MTWTDEQRDYAHKTCMSMIKNYVATKYEADNLTEDELMIFYLDVYNVGMDMFNHGLQHATI